MNEALRILWLDNDPGQIHGFVVSLKRAGFDVTVTTSVKEAEDLMLRGRFGLIILDVMIPVSDEEEADGYGGDATDDGHKTGLAFFRRHKSDFLKHGDLMIFTVRVDKPIRDEFVAEGLSASKFVTKLELRDSKVFVEAVKRRVAAGAKNG